MDTKFIITRERRVLRPGDIFAFCLRSPFIRRCDFVDGDSFCYTDIRHYNKDVNICCSSSRIVAPRGYICKSR